MKILVDLDGVLGNFQDHALQEHVINPRTFDWSCGWDMWKGIGCTLPEFWAKLEERGSEFWATVPLYRWSKPMWRALKDIGDCYICTSPPICPSSAKGKMIWIQEFLGSRYTRDFVITPQKHLLADSNTLLIDDRPKTVAKFQDYGGHALLFPQPWNSEIVLPNRHSMIVEEARRIITLNT